jgi:DNA-binding PadR family transcriptional regulator
MHQLPIAHETNLKILHYLAEHGPANKYRIRKEGGAGSQPTVLDAIDELEKSGAIKIVDEKTNVRGSTPSKYYDLTPEGLRTLILGLDHLGLRQSHVNYLYRGLAKKYYEYCPCVFKFWPDFVKASVEVLAQRRCLRLTQATQNDPDWSKIADHHCCYTDLERSPYYYPRPNEGRSYTGTKEDWYRRMREFLLDTDPHYQVFLDPFQPETDETERENWLAFIRQNSRLRQLTADVLRGMIDQHIEDANKILEFMVQPTIQLLDESERAELEQKVEELEDHIEELKQETKREERRLEDKVNEEIETEIDGEIAEEE